MANARKGLIQFRFVELYTNKYIAGMYHQVKEANGRLIAEGKSNAEGLSVQISRDIGTELHVYVKSTFTGQMKLKIKYALQYKEEIHRIISSKVLLDNVPLQQHEAPKGSYKRKTYTVERGDTLTAIAHKNHCTVNELISINALKDHGNHIVPGQLLKLPTGTGSRAPHRAGQTNTSHSPANQHPQHSHAKPPSTNPRSDNPQPSEKTVAANNASAKAKIAQPTSGNMAENNKAAEKTPPSTGTGVQNQQGNSEKTGAPVCDVKNTACPCVCKAYDLIWSSKVDCAFRKKVIEIAEELWPKDAKNMASNLMACMHLETGGTFRANIDNGLAKDADGIGYVGLIQFGNDICKDLKISKKKLKAMNEVEQLDWVKKRFLLGNANTKIKNLTDLYLIINYPNSVLQGKNRPNDNLYNTQSAYHSNPSFMKEPGEREHVYSWKLNKQGKRVPDKRGFEDGKTYIWEVTEELTQNHYISGQRSNNRTQKFECNNQPYPLPQNTSIACPLCKVQHIDLRKIIQWRTQFDPMWGNQAKQNVACWKTSQLILTESGLGASSGYQTGYIGIATEVNKHTALSYNTVNLTKAVVYLDSELSLKNPVLIGVNHDLNYRGEQNNDHTTDHFVVVVGTGCDNGKRYYLFYDVGTRRKDAGISDGNKLYILDNRIEGRTAYDSKKLYTVAQIRMNSKK